MQEKRISRPKVGPVDHIAIEVTDLAVSLEFYQGILGLSEQPMPYGVKEKGICWLDLGNGLALHLVEKPEARPGKTAHLAIHVEDVRQWHDYLNQCGVSVHSAQVAIYTAERIFCTDPSGNRIEFVKWL